MAIVDVRDVSVLEEDNSFQYVNFTVFLDTASSAPVTIYYYFRDISASAAYGDYYGGSGSATIGAGDTTATIDAVAYGDLLVEGNETFELVVIAGQNATLAGNAAALVATATIMDNDDGVSDPAPGVGALADRLYGPASASPSLPTVTAYGIFQKEGDSSFQHARFLVLLDQPATTSVTLSYYFQDGSASGAYNDYTPVSGTATISAGQQATWIGATVYGDTAIEPDETFNLVLWNATNAVFANNAASLMATATILDDDGTPFESPAGMGPQAVPIATPASESSTLPTLDVRDVAVYEGDSSYEYARFLVLLDKPATANVTGYYYFQDGTASGAYNEYSPGSGSFTISAGQQSTWISAAVYGDTAIEGDETFNLVLTGLTNAVFANGGAALVATGTIIDDDGTSTTVGGVGDFSDPVTPPVSVSGPLPTLQVHDTKVFEGDSSFEYARFLVTLDRPATSMVTFYYDFEDGSASNALGDFNQTSGSTTIAAGQQSTWLQAAVYGDIAIEGDETFSLVLSNITNAVFDGGAPALQATGTIIDDDGGSVSGGGGVSRPALQVRGPDSSGGVVMDAVDTSVAEGDSSFDYVFVHLLFSEPLTTSVSVSYQTLDGAAEDGTDYNGISGTATFGAGTESDWFRISVYGDTANEGDESFILRLSNASGFSFANGQSTMDATVLIRDNDGSGTAGSAETGPQFSYIPAGTEYADDLTGTDHADTIDGLGGNDTITGLAGADNLKGGTGNDTIEGGPGGDAIDGGTGTDTATYAHSSSGVTVQLQYNIATGGDAAGDTLTSIERLTGSSHNDLLVGNPSNNIIRGGGGNDTLKGLNGADNLYGDAGDDWLYVDNLDNAALGGSGTDRLIVVNGNGVTNAVGANGIEIATGNTGDDTFDGTGATVGLTLRGRSGNDVLTGGDGDDYLFGDSGADELRGGAGLDRLFVDENDTVINGGAGSDDRVIVQQLASATTGVSIDMAASEVEVAYGNLNDDTFDGSSATVALSLYGRNGQDVLTGGSANDRLFGDNNDAASGDILNGGEGNDFLRGGSNGAGGFAERDQFVFDADWGNDRIFDFADNGAEKIDFNSIAGITQRSDLTITDGSGFALISYHDAVGGWDASIRVDGVTAAELQNNDFIFV
ncbi:MAG: hypothetical protein KDJ77_09545 [Rhodobiaceae bacterium]|nr:hypothetical protein [Rhodobiaceae bacterium]